MIIQPFLSRYSKKISHLKLPSWLSERISLWVCEPRTRHTPNGLRGDRIPAAPLSTEQCSPTWVAPVYRSPCATLFHVGARSGHGIWVLRLSREPASPATLVSACRSLLSNN